MRQRAWIFGLLLCVALPGWAAAQDVGIPGGTVVSGGSGFVPGASTSFGMMSIWTGSTMQAMPFSSAPAAPMPYSYFAAFPGPARIYVPYGTDDIFPFGGQPYGHAYDRFSWSSLSGSSRLDRYYYPPVR